jgi:membrane protein
LRSLSALLPRLRTRARSVVDRPADEWGPLSRAGVLTIHVLVSCARKLRRDRGPQMASALAFQTLFSLIPLLILVLIVLDSVNGLEGSGAQLRNMIVDYLVPQSLIAPEPQPGLVGPPDPNRPATLEEFDDARQVLRLRIDRFLEELSQVSFAGIGVAGFLLFIYGATALMRTVESSFNHLYQADDPPPWSRLPLYFTLLTLGPLALVAAQILQDRLLAHLDTFLGGWFYKPFAYVAPLLVSCIVLGLAFRSIPNTWVSWRAAVIGGLWSGLAWFAFQEIFGYYVNHYSMISVFGALALVPLFLLWIYWSWLIILAGLALSFIVQYIAADEHWARRLLLPADPRLLVPIMVRIAQGFVSAEKITTARLSLELGVPPRILRPYVHVLEREGYVRGLRDRADQHVLTLARPASAISVREILELAPPVRTPVAADVVDALRRSELEAADTRTLEELADQSAAPESPPADEVVEAQPEDGVDPRTGAPAAPRAASDR